MRKIHIILGREIVWSGSGSGSRRERWEVGNGNEDDSSTCKDPYHGMVTMYLLPTISFFQFTVFIQVRLEAEGQLCCLISIKSFVKLILYL